MTGNRPKKPFDVIPKAAFVKQNAEGDLVPYFADRAEERRMAKGFWKWWAVREKRLKKHVPDVTPQRLAELAAGLLQAWLAAITWHKTQEGAKDNGQSHD